VIAVAAGVALVALSAPSAPLDVAGAPAGARRTPSGVASVVLAAGRGRERPGGNDCLKLRYAAWTRAGQVVAARLEGQPEVQCLQRLPPGVAEVLRAMRAGEKRRAWVPARLAAAAGEEAATPVDVTYELELVEIIPAPPTPAPLRVPPGDARRLSSGLAVKILEPRPGPVRPAPQSQVRLHLSGWTAGGALVESTVMAGHPLVSYVSELIPGLREGVQQLAVGERARLWIPADLAYGDHPRRRGQPAGALVYDVQLLEVK
jgi:peptidylprolyl isomerase